MKKQTLLEAYENGLLRPSLIVISPGIIPDYVWMRTSIGASFPMISNRLPPRVMESAYGQYRSLALQEAKQIQLMHEKRYDYNFIKSLHSKRIIADINFDYQKVIKSTKYE